MIVSRWGELPEDVELALAISTLAIQLVGDVNILHRYATVRWDMRRIELTAVAFSRAMRAYPLPHTAVVASIIKLESSENYSHFTAFASQDEGTRIAVYTCAEINRMQYRCIVIDGVK